MKCRLCGTDNDISTNITSCVKCGSDLPYTDINFYITEHGQKKTTSGEGRMAIDGDRIAFSRKSKGKQALALGAMGLLGKALYDQYEKGGGAYRVYNRSDFTDIQKVQTSAGTLQLYKLTTPQEEIKILPATRKIDFLIEEMDKFMSIQERPSIKLETYRSHGQ